MNSFLRRIFSSSFGRGFSSVVMFLSLFFSIFSAFPVMLSYVSESRKKAFQVIAFGAIVSYLIASIYLDSPLQLSLAYLLIVTPVSIIISELAMSGLRITRIVFIATLVMTGFYASLLLILSYSSGVIGFMSEHVALAVATISEQSPETIRQVLLESGMTEDELVRSIVVQIPRRAVIVIMIFVLINVLMISGFLRSGQKVLNIQGLQYFKMPDKLVWLVILSGIMHLYATSEYNHAASLEILSGLLIYLFLGFYFMHGMLITHVITTVRIPSAFFRILLFSLLVVFAYILITAVGFFDTWFDFRKYFNKKGEK